ncbi:MAG: hypothetical protein K2X93_10770 [Candidatus Obscuribacterales bacterium]|nr:hypothetical protein [Candidatus Obscuribacterales bacterium]
MSIEYLVHFECPVRDEFPNENFIRQIKNRGHAHAIIEIAKEDGNPLPPSELTISRVLYTPGGQTQSQEVSVQTLLDESEHLFSLKDHCTECPVNLLKQPFSCYGTIAYPILKSTEEWLLSRLPKEESSAALNMMLRYIEDFEIDGGPVNEMRGDPTFFESSEPPKRIWSATGASISSSQLLQMLFCVGPIEPPHAKAVLFYLNFISHTTDMDSFLEIIQSSGAQNVEFSNFDYQDANLQVCDFNDFFLAMVASISIDSLLLLDF